MAYYGEDYEIVITSKDALRLAGKPIKAGYESVIATASLTYRSTSTKTELCVANIYGRWQVQCSNLPKDKWLDVFKFDPQTQQFLNPEAPS